MGKKNGQECRALTNVWYDISPIVPWSKERNGHPTQKPLQLIGTLGRHFGQMKEILFRLYDGVRNDW